jgi:hypothetical protein
MEPLKIRFMAADYGTRAVRKESDSVTATRWYFQDCNDSGYHASY